MVLLGHDFGNFRDAFIAFEFWTIVHVSRDSPQIANSGMLGRTIFSCPSSYVLCSIEQNDASIPFLLLAHRFVMPV